MQFESCVAPRLIQKHYPFKSYLGQISLSIVNDNFVRVKYTTYPIIIGSRKKVTSSSAI